MTKSIDRVADHADDLVLSTHIGGDPDCADPDPAQTLDRDQLQRRPAVRRIPLTAGGLRAGEQSAGRFEAIEIAGDAPRLIGRGDSGPQRIERRGELVRPPPLGLDVVVEVQPGVRVP